MHLFLTYWYQHIFTEHHTKSYSYCYSREWWLIVHHITYRELPFMGRVHHHASASCAMQGICFLSQTMYIRNSVSILSFPYSITRDILSFDNYVALLIVNLLAYYYGAGPLRKKLVCPKFSPVSRPNEMSSLCEGCLLSDWVNKNNYSYSAALHGKFNLFLSKQECGKALSAHYDGYY